MATIDLKTLRGNWNYPTAVRFGPGRIAELPDACRALGMTRPLLVTDPGLAKLLMVDQAAARNTKAGLPTVVFADVKPNPVGKNVDDGVAAFRAHKADGVIAFGGGSALDVAKAIALMVGQTRPLWDFEDREDWYTRVNVAGMAPCVAVPTTSGTGSEVGRVSVITDERDHVKKLIFHARMQPAIVIDDPELTVGLPAGLTAATGMDALSHNLEAYCAPGFHPMAEGIALEGMRLIRDWLPAAVKDGNDVAARSYMMVASTMGATAFQKGLGAMHALSHPIGAHFDTHHGRTNAVVMPYVLAFNRAAIEDKMTALARYIGLPKANGAAVIDWVLELRQTIGIEHTLKDLGVGAEHAGRIAPEAARDPSAPSNPVPLDEAKLATLFRNAAEGRLA
ncbi:MAG: iron-containing alcohol dehydrogenase [Alphaproteobacteria bacterium]|nr:iron-containing alcohol dehydrogenase [Alphaproteobacteria bacterium]